MIDAGRFDFEIIQGATYEAVLVYVDETDAPMSLEDYDIVFQARKSRDARSELIIELSTYKKSLMVTDAAGGQFTMQVTAEQAYNLPSGVFEYDMALVSKTVLKRVVPILSGKLRVLQSAIGAHTDPETRSLISF